MNKTRKILLLVEGAKLEVVLLNKAFKEYELDLNYIIYPYQTTIYELYERMFEGNEDELDTLDLLGILKEKDPNNESLDENFSDILLVFDYEPQDNRFSQDRLDLMLNYFNESTDNGKLYINYPMCESFKHLKSIPDPDYNKLTIDLSVVSAGKYKELVGKETKFTNFNKYNKSVFNAIIIHNIEKAYKITKDNEHPMTDISNSYFELKPLHILKIQNELLENYHKIYVLNTCLFFICDYKISLILN